MHLNENNVCKMAAILFRHHCVNTLRLRQMDAIFQTTFSNAFSWMKMYEFWLRFHWSLFPRVKITTFQHWFRQCLGADQATSHYLNQWWKVYWSIYASLGLSELILDMMALKNRSYWHLICSHISMIANRKWRHRRVSNFWSTDLKV